MVIKTEFMSGRSAPGVVVGRYPNVCPVCNNACVPVFKYGMTDDTRPQPWVLQAVYLCPNNACGCLFFAWYEVCDGPVVFDSKTYQGNLQLTDVIPKYQVTRTFGEAVEQLSPEFCNTYRQAETAENNGLRLLCGIGYRRVLQFLVKDFIVKHVVASDVDEVERIKQAFLGTCIRRYIDDPRIRAVAERAVWRGNDEAHYVRRWEDKDLDDLKRLINMTVNWVELVLESAAYQKTMPDGKSNPAAATST